MKVIRLILLLPIDVLIILGIVIVLLTSKIDEILKIAVIGLIDIRKNYEKNVKPQKQVKSNENKAFCKLGHRQSIACGWL